MRSLSCAAVVFACGVALSRAAVASPVETFGFLPEDNGRAGASTSAGDVASCAVVNPGACARGDARPEVALGWGYQHLSLSLNGSDPGVMDVHGTSLGVGAPYALGPLRMGAGFALYLPDQFIARIALEPATRPRFVMWENRVHRAVVFAVGALELARGVDVGAGVTVFADGAGNGVQFDIGEGAGRTVASGALDVSLPVRAAPTVGLYLGAPGGRIAAGLRVTGPISLNLALDVNARVHSEGLRGVNGDAVISARGVDYYTPLEVAAGGRVSLTTRLRVLVDLAYRRWSDAPSPSSDVALLLRIGASPSRLAGSFGPPGYRDILVPRLAGEYDVPAGRRGPVTVRAGLSYVPTPVPAQTGPTSYVDPDRVEVALGASAPLGSQLGVAFRASLSLDWIYLVPMETQRRELSAPGGDLSASGSVLGATASLAADF